MRVCIESEVIGIKEKYQDVLNYLDKHTDYVELVDVDFSEMEEIYDTVLRNLIFNNILGYEKVSKWMGTEISGEKTNQKLTVKYSSDLYDYIKLQEFFYRKENLSNLLFNSKGQADIAFFDKYENCLLYTTTSEGTIGLCDELDSLIFV